MIPYDLDKNLGRAYNKMIQQVPDDEWVCLMDYDVMLLTPDAGLILHNYALRYPDSLLTCYTNRIHPTSPQLFNGSLSANYGIRHHIEIANEVKSKLYTVTKINSTISGFLMMFPKSLWKDFKFSENLKCLGVDTDFSTRLIHAGKNIYRMNGCYVFHQYRLMTDPSDKTHLL